MVILTFLKLYEINTRITKMQWQLPIWLRVIQLSSLSVFRGGCLMSSMRINGGCYKRYILSITQLLKSIECEVIKKTIVVVSHFAPVTLISWQALLCSVRSLYRG